MGKLIGVVMALMLAACAAQQPPQQASVPPPQGSPEQGPEPGDANTQFNLAEMYYYGRGVDVDYAEAASWYRKAADQGNVAAIYSLGYLYEMNRGVARDYAQALALYRKAAEQGLARAQFRLAGLYANGHGTDVDTVQAYAWYDISSARLDTASRKAATGRRDRIARKMTAAELAKAKKLVSDCRQSNMAVCGAVEKAALHAAVVANVPRPAVAPSEVTFLTAGLPTGRHGVTLESVGGVYTVPVRINDSMTLKFIVDSGAADVSIPADVVVTLMRDGAIQAADFLESRTFTMASGTRAPLKTFRIRSLKVGDVVVTNVTGIVSSANAPLLLGQSFLNQFTSWSVDNRRHVLLLE